LKATYTIAIPMAGLGTRMRPHTWSKPKPLIHLAGKTVLDYVLGQFRSLPRVDEAQFVLILGSNQVDQVKAHIAQYYPEMHVNYLVQEKMRGQSDALYQARELLKGPVLMSFSDTLIEADLAFLDSEPADGVAWVKAVPDPRRFGVALIDGQGLIQRLVEKPDSMENNLAVVGFYYFRSGEALIGAIRKQIEENISLDGEFFLVDAINLMITGGDRFRTQPVDVWLDAGKPESLLETNRYLLDHGSDNSQAAQKRQGVIIVPPVFIHPEAQLERCVIGPHVSIDQHASISDSIVKDAIVEQDAHINHMVLTGSHIGRAADIRGRAEVVNIGDNSWLEI
jgi:glucose-1-phosphate thymidylyltransferase